LRKVAAMIDPYMFHIEDQKAMQYLKKAIER
jgi:hypothetical protein